MQAQNPTGGTHTRTFLTGRMITGKPKPTLPQKALRVAQAL
jgi:hypothetical protein